jgi:predicted AAA+ superfamily ATPase
MENYIPRIFNPPKHNYFLFGPRGTGKSTYLKHLYPNALWIDLLEPDIFRSFTARPERLKELVLANLNKETVVIDEIQKVPELLSLIHSLIEQKLNVQFILTGSSSRKLKRTRTDLLAGRVIKNSLHPFMATELGNNFNIDTALQTGLLPIVLSSAEPQKVIKSYIALYIKEEIQTEGLVRNIGNFSRFLESISFSHGSVLNITNVARDCEVERKVVEGYISILEDLLLGYRLPVFTKRAKRMTICHPKFYFFDAGVFRSLRPAGPLDQPEGIEGVALEGLIAQHLIAWSSYDGDRNKTYFWRTSAGSEIDFIVYGETVFWAIEVRNTKKVRPTDLNPLISFKKDYTECNTCLIYRGTEKININGVLCIPASEFLNNLVPGKNTFL